MAKKDEKKVDFDLSVLELDELISVNKKIDEFIAFLSNKKIDIEKKVAKK